MKNKFWAISNYCFLFLAVFFLGACSGILQKGNDDYIDGSKGLVTIHIDSGKTFLSSEIGDYNENIQTERTMVPNSLGAVNYTLRFKAFPVAPAGEKIVEIENLTIGSDNKISVTLETGDWTLDVFMYANGSLIAANEVSYGPFPVEPGNNSDVPITIKPVAGTGQFKYTVNSTASASGTLELRGENGNIIKSTLDSGTTWPDITLNDIPSGNYDVIVSLETPDGKKAGKHSAAIIYPGLLTNTTSGYFNFSSFVTNLGLAGMLNITGSTNLWLNASDPNVRIKVYNVNGVLQNTAPNGLEFKWVNSSAEWVINIPFTVWPVYFDVEVRDIDGNWCKREKAHDASSFVIPNKGLGLVDGSFDDRITLSTGIYGITKNNSSAWPSGASSIAATVNSVTRNYASPGEKVDLAVSSGNDLKKGTLNINTTIIPNEISTNNYSFTMPAGNAAINAEFFNLELSSISITHSQGTTSIPSFSSSNTGPYNVKVPFGLSSLQINAQPVVLSDVLVSITVESGSLLDLSPTTNTVVNVKVTPNPGLGGGIGNKTYVLYITRDPSTVCDLTGLSIDQGTLYFDSSKNYSVSVPYNVDDITVTATPKDPNSSIKYYYYSGTSYSLGSSVSTGATLTPPQSLAVGNNYITIRVTAEDGTTVSNPDYIITVDKAAVPPSTDNRLSEIFIYNKDDHPDYDPDIDPSHFGTPVGSWNVVSIINSGYPLTLGSPDTNGIDYIDIVATPVDINASATIKDGFRKTLNIGTNEFYIQVLSESNEERIIILQITRNN